MPLDGRRTSRTNCQIGIFLFDGVEELDAVGPFEVLAHWTQQYPEDGWATTCISESGSPVTGAQGLVIGAHTAAADAPTLDVFVHPGGRGTRPLLRNETHLSYVRRQKDEAPLVASVCTGSLVFAAAGLLSGRPATTHWAATNELAALDPTVAIEADARFVDDGDIVTSAGVSAGIDMALHLVRRLAGVQRAREVQRAIQYDH
ncbi:MAG: hypothetical protein QOG46_928 [Pseudonocardiales bacterium]|jgi:transcriptional regulator GlxA family with amidase domain|nr:hypothetical protein [Pseudonocardiales bacterium]